MSASVESLPCCRRGDSFVADDPVSENIVRAEGRITGEDREILLGHPSITVWFTGLSGSGKSTLAFAVEEALVHGGSAAYVLDGDNIRFGLNRDLGFAPADRTENIRRIGEVCKLFADAGVVTLASFISPYAADRDAARAMHEEVGLKFIECHVDVSLEIAEERDPKGLYKKSRAGEIKGFTGIDDPYEAPSNAELVINTGDQSLDESVASVLECLRAHGLHA